MRGSLLIDALQVKTNCIDANAEDVGNFFTAFACLQLNNNTLLLR